ncbi:hypothetical protein [Nonomuraea sp. NPDC005650]|uniref:hypothetical protein n=1 Tax=Nonomuraea sp. NPDC005650 TaxID=3157045 RepID=UPI0033B837FC
MSDGTVNVVVGVGQDVTGGASGVIKRHDDGREILRSVERIELDGRGGARVFTAEDAEIPVGGRDGAEWSRLVQGLMGPMPVVELLILAQGMPQVALVEKQASIQEFSTAPIAHVAEHRTPPPLLGKVVDVKLTDMTSGPMRVTVTPGKVPEGTVSVPRVQHGHPGPRTRRATAREGPGHRAGLRELGDAHVAPWTVRAAVHLPGHYAAGMHAALDVTK